MITKSIEIDLRSLNAWLTPAQMNFSSRSACCLGRARACSRSSGVKNLAVVGLPWMGKYTAAAAATVISPS